MTEDNGPKSNSLGYVEIGGGNEDHSDLNGMGESDCLIRSTREDRLCMKDVLDENGYIAMSIPGVVAQTADPEAEKQVKGVITLPTAVGPNVYAANEADLDIAMKKRYEEKARTPYLTIDQKKITGVIPNRNGLNCCYKPLTN